MRDDTAAPLNWNWDHLRYFIALADKGSLTLAGRELEVSHSTVLRRVRAFERSLRTSLFEQTPGGYRLTTAGERLYAEAGRARHVLDDVVEEIIGADQRIAGEVTLTTPDTIGFSILPPIVERLQTSHPELTLNIDVVNSLVDIPNRAADIALRTGAHPPDNLIGRRVGPVRFLVCAARGYAEPRALREFPADTTAHRFVTLDERYKGAAFHRWLHERIDGAATVMRVSGFLGAYALCRSGNGITVLPEYLVRNDATLVALSTDAPVPPNELWLLGRAGQRDTARIQLVRRFLHEALSEVFGP